MAWLGWLAWLVTNPYYYNTEEFIYKPVDTEESIYFYPSTDPRIDGFYGKNVSDLPEVSAERLGDDRSYFR